MYRVIDGYSGLFIPPFENLDCRGTSIYCITTDSKRTLVAVPLTPHFFNDLYNIVKHPQYQKLILVMSSTDCIYISDIYNLFAEVTVNLRKQFELICPEGVSIPTSDVFIPHIRKGHHATITILHSQLEQLAATIDFVDTSENSRSKHDIIVSTASKKIYFAHHMTTEKMQWLRENAHMYDEIHIPFANSIYGGLGYMDLRKLGTLSFLAKFRVYGFKTTEEADFCQRSGISYGEVVYRDLV